MLAGKSPILTVHDCAPFYFALIRQAISGSYPGSVVLHPDQADFIHAVATTYTELFYTHEVGYSIKGSDLDTSLIRLATIIGTDEFGRLEETWHLYDCTGSVHVPSKLVEAFHTAWIVNQYEFACGMARDYARDLKGQP